MIQKIFDEHDSCITDGTISKTKRKEKILSIHHSINQQINKLQNLERNKLSLVNILCSADILSFNEYLNSNICVDMQGIVDESIILPIKLPDMQHLIAKNMLRNAIKVCSFLTFDKIHIFVNKRFVTIEKYQQ